MMKPGYFYSYDFNTAVFPHNNMRNAIGKIKRRELFLCIEYIHDRSLYDKIKVIAKNKIGWIYVYDPFQIFDQPE